MSDLFKDLAKLFAREVAVHVVDMLTSAKPGAEDIGKAATAKATPTPVALPAGDRSEAEWRDDCLAIINQLAPTHGKQLRALLADFDNAKRLSDVKHDGLPLLFERLTGLQRG